MDTQPLSWSNARSICIVRTLAALGHHPVKITPKEAWFLSPLRSETHASFNVSLQKNLWFDYGLGKGGNAIDLIMILKDCCFKEALAVLSSDSLDFSFCPPPSTVRSKRDTSIKILRNTTLSHPALLGYIVQRGVQVTTARQYCQQVWYQIKGQEYFSIGLQNNSGGWELRNKYCKSSSSPKDLTLIQNNMRRLILLEGMFDLLSLATLYPNLKQQADLLILNSVAFAEKALAIGESYESIELYLDRDEAGRKTTTFFLNENPKYTDRSACYKDQKDLNAWLMKK